MQLKNFLLACLLSCHLFGAEDNIIYKAQLAVTPDHWFSKLYKTEEDAEEAFDNNAILKLSTEIYIRKYDDNLYGFYIENPIVIVSKYPYLENLNKEYYSLLYSEYINISRQSIEYLDNTYYAFTFSNWYDEQFNSLEDAQIAIQKKSNICDYFTIIEVNDVIKHEDNPFGSLQYYKHWKIMPKTDLFDLSLSSLDNSSITDDSSYIYYGSKN